MSVKDCNRLGCKTIMCKRISRKFGYLCDDCFNELVTLGFTANVSKFMETEKQFENREIAFVVQNKEFPIT